MSRVDDRHGKGADDWPLSEQAATEYFERSERPTPEEGPLQVVTRACRSRELPPAQLPALNRRAKAPNDDDNVPGVLSHDPF